MNITVTCPDCLCIHASDEQHACPGANASTDVDVPARVRMQSYDDLIDERVRMLMREWPTLDEAHACVNCHAIVRMLNAQQRCPRCGSESTFDLASALASPRADTHAGISAADLLPALNALDSVLSS